MSNPLTSSGGSPGTRRGAERIRGYCTRPGTLSPGQPRRWPLPRAHKSLRATAFHSSLPSQDMAIPADYTAGARGKLHLPLPGREDPQGKSIDKKKNEISFVHVANLPLFLLRPSALAGESISSAINLLGSSQPSPWHQTLLSLF